MASLNAHRQQLTQEREKLRNELKSAEEEEDPLAVYNRFVEWTLKNYANHSESGLLELLEEVVRVFKDDIRYKFGDLRYVKLWILFANHVERPSEVYAHMMREGIGKPYALFFEEYAEALEREKRFSEAEAMINLGIKTQAKPLKRLQAFHDNYVTRRAAEMPLTPRVAPFRDDTWPPAISIIRTQPLKNIASHALPTPPHNDVSKPTTQAISSAEFARPSPYAHLNAPAVPGKRPEKLQFDITLLLDADGQEYCFEEARARHLGLLGKKWPPPPPPNPMGSYEGVGAIDENGAQEPSLKVDFNDHGTKTGRGTRRQSATVTINTKQALEDVFDMYNSPVKGREDADGHGNGAMAPPVELQQVQNIPSARPQQRDENMTPHGKPHSFQPHVDHQRKENATGPLKLKSGATKTPGSNTVIPNSTRKALAAKEIITHIPTFNKVRPEQGTTRTISSEPQTSGKEREQQETDIFSGGDVTAEQYTEVFTNPQPPPARSFVPFVDAHQDLSTGRHNEEQRPSPVSKILKFQVHRGENAPLDPQPKKATSSSQKHFQTSFQAKVSEKRMRFDDGNTSEAPLTRENDEERQSYVKSRRFPDFDVMTPITERTFEYTASTRAVDTPGSERPSRLHKDFIALDALDAAERLAAEVLADEESEGETNASRKRFRGQEPSNIQNLDENSNSSGYSLSGKLRTTPFRVSEGLKAKSSPNGTLYPEGDGDKLIPDGQTGAAEVPLEVQNPCVPSDPAILSKLISLFPVDPNYRDLGHTIADQLGMLQRFIEKRSRRGSAASSAGRTSDGSDKFVLELDNDQFEVIDKLGEGGFGAVFMARTMTSNSSDIDDEDEEYEGDGDEGLIAIKAVRPADRWESFVLRRVTSRVPKDLLSSIIRPHVLYAYRDESYLTLEVCHQGTLLEIVNRATEIGVAQPGGSVHELLVMFFTIELLRIIQGLHESGFVHGDLKIDNCLIRLEDVPGGSSAWSTEYSPVGAGGWAYKGIKLIDFGRTIDRTLFPEEQKFVSDWKTDGRDCFEMREGKPWTYQPDYSGLASIVYCMLFGKYMETVEVPGHDGARRVKPAQPMKRYWQSDFWNRLFDTLLNPCQLRPDGWSLPITKEIVALRTELETWVQLNCNKGGKSLKSMLQKIEIATLHRTPRK